MSEKEITPKQLLLKVASGNPGAITLLIRLRKKGLGFEVQRYLYENDIVGSRLWEVYKDIYKEEFETFARDIERRELQDNEGSDVKPGKNEE